MAARGQPQRETIPSDFYRQNPFDVRTYPAARKKRPGPEPGAGPGDAAGSGGGAAQIPISHSFAFALQCGVINTRVATSSKLLRGPVLIRGLAYAKTGTPLGTFGFGLGVSSSPITETNVPIATALPYRPIYEGLPKVNLPPTGENNTDVIVDLGNVNLVSDPSIGAIIIEPEFHLVVYAASTGGAAVSLDGHVNLLEQVSREALAFYLG